MSEPMLLIVASLAALGAAALIVAREVLGAHRQVRASLRRAAGLDVEVHVDAAAPAHGRLLPALAAALGGLSLRLHRRRTRETVQQRLASAGALRRLSPDAYLAVEGALALGAAALGLLVASASGSFARGLLLLLMFGAAGLLLPDRLLGLRAAKRRERIQAALPGALDLLAVTVEAGLSLDGAVAKVVDATEGPLADEFAFMLAEVRVGESRSEALRRLAERVDSAEVTSFARAVVRADQLGASLGQTLRMQSTEARQRRQAAAEERAAKAPVKMLFPTVMLIFPAMFVVTLGPALLQIKNLL